MVDTIIVRTQQEQYQRDWGALLYFWFLIRYVAPIVLILWGIFPAPFMSSQMSNNLVVIGAIWLILAFLPQIIRVTRYFRKKSSQKR